MFLTITDASKGKPYTLQAPIDNSDGKLTIGIRSISMWVGWYNIYEEQTWRWSKPAEGAGSTEIKLEAGLYSFSELVEILTSEIEGLSIMVKHSGGAGSITAAEFLQRFIINKTPWVHLDIAGMAFSKKAASLNPSGATGFGVRLLNKLIEDSYE